MEKSPDAFRTISEVAELLETPAHVLRFWESRFPQIRPVKRAGGRRYYRPADVGLLTGIKRLLHDEGMTIRGVQKILREQGVRYVSGMADDSSAEDDDAALEAALASSSGPADDTPSLPAAEAETAQIIALQTALNEPEEAQAEAADAVPAGSEEDADTEANDSNEAAEVKPVSPVPTPFVPRAKDPAPEPPARKPPSDDGIPDLFHRMVSAASATEDDVLPTEAESDDEVEVFDFNSGPVSEPDPAEDQEEAEAPMALWADTADAAPDEVVSGQSDASPPIPPMLKVTRIGNASIGNPAPSAPPAAPPEEKDSQAGETPMAARLRATLVSDLSTSDRATLTLIRARARSLKDRLGAPPRLDL